MILVKKRVLRVCPRGPCEWLQLNLGPALVVIVFKLSSSSSSLSSMVPRATFVWVTLWLWTRAHGSADELYGRRQRAAQALVNNWRRQSFSRSRSVLVLVDCSIVHSVSECDHPACQAKCQSVLACAVRQANLISLLLQLLLVTELNHTRPYDNNKDDDNTSSSKPTIKVLSTVKFTLVRIQKACAAAATAAVNRILFNEHSSQKRAWTNLSAASSN